jgi:GT2 family glycosyltransferase
MSSVDVVVPCYNYGRYLKGCVESVLSQRDVYVRVLIIDDASLDDTLVVGKQLAAADRRVSYVRNEVNLGLIPTANKGVMDWAAADYVVLLSADDALAPGSLARAANLMGARPDVVLTYGMALMFHDNGAALKLSDPQDPPFAVIPGEVFLRRICESGNAVPTPSAIIRTSVQHQIGGYNPLFKHTSDVNMWMRAAAAGSIGVVKAVQSLYRWHLSNMSAAYQRRPIGDRAEMLATCQEFLESHGKDFPEFGEWFRQMKRRFGDESILVASKLFEASTDDAWRGILEFGKKCRRDYWKSAVWWKFVLKGLAGQQVTHSIQGLEDRVGLRYKADPSSRRAAWYDHGMQIGWWPEECRITL